MSERVHLIGLVDYRVFLVTARNADLIKQTTNPALAIINEWTSLQLTPEKTEAVIFARNWVSVLLLNVHRINIKYRALHYRLTLGPHTKKIVTIAAKTIGALEHLQLNLKSPSQVKRALHLLVSNQPRTFPSFLPHEIRHRFWLGMDASRGVAK